MTLNDLYQRALKALAKEEYAQARDDFAQIIQTDSQIADAWAGLAQAQAGLGETASALTNLNTGLRLLPGNLALRQNKAVILMALEQFDEAKQCLLQILEEQPQSLQALINLAKVYYECRELEAAQKSFQTAQSIEPDDANLLFNLSCFLTDVGYVDDALTALNRMLSLYPEHAQARNLRAQHYLARHDWKNAWHDYEARWHCPPLKFDFLPCPSPWRGEPLLGKRLIIWGEQGVGDEVLFNRCLAQLPHEAHIQYVTDARFKTLFQRTFTNIEIIARLNQRSQIKELVNHSDYQIHVGDLCQHFITENSPPDHTLSRLSIDAKHVADLRNKYRLQSRGKRLVGIAWHSRNQLWGASKACPLDLWEPIFRVDGLTFLNLQYGAHTQEINAAQQRFNTHIISDADIDTTNDLDAFTHQIAAMDHIVSIDNATINFAGALNVDAHLLAPIGANWRWGFSGQYSPWYPSVKIHRQQAFGDWSHPVEAIAADLSQEMRKP